MKKYVELYLYIGGDKENIKTEMEIVNQMRVKQAADDEFDNDLSLSGTEIEDKVYESVIKKEIMKGYSADEIGQSLKHQEEIIEMIIKREQVKFKQLQNEKQLFRQKISFLNGYFQFEDIDRQNEAERQKLEVQKSLQK